MYDTISQRSKKILRSLTGRESLSRLDIEKLAKETRNNTIRELAKLIEQGYIAVSGEARATVYSLTGRGRSVVSWNAEEYLRQDLDERGARFTGLEPSLLQLVKGSIGQAPVVVEAAAGKRRKSANGDSVTARKDLERFVIELSWKSSKIEGNTYTLLDTQRLIQEDEEAPGHDHAEAIMILNHKKAFDYIWQHPADFRHLTASAIEDIHRLLVAGLNVPFGLRSTPVGITGTVYIPPASKSEVSSYLHDIVDIINDLDQPVEKALACLVLLPYLQPFADGNKRTSRLMANAVLLAFCYPPLSYRGINEQAYKSALILFYEQGVLANFRDLYLEQLEESALNYFFPTEMTDNTSHLV